MEIKITTHLTHLKRNGFTLIELLLVLALITMIIAFSVGVYQTQMLNFKLDKTSLQLQQWLEGARAYYIYSGSNQQTSGGTYSWPVPNSNNSNCTTNALLEGDTTACPQLPTPPPIFILPNTIDMSPFGKNAPYQFVGVVNPNTANGTIFEVDLTIPSNVQHAKVIAQRIASRLPSASVNGTTVSVFAAIPSGNMNAPTGTTIISIQDIRCAPPTQPGFPPCQAVILPKNATCPPNTTMREHLSINNLTSPLDNGGGNVMLTQVFSSPNFFSTLPSTVPAFNTQGPAFNNNGQSYTAYGYTGQMVAIISCDQNQLPGPEPGASANSNTNPLERF